MRIPQSKKLTRFQHTFIHVSNYYKTKDKHESKTDTRGEEEVEDKVQRRVKAINQRDTKFNSRM